MKSDLLLTELLQNCFSSRTGQTVSIVFDNLFFTPTAPVQSWIIIIITVV